MNYKSLETISAESFDEVFSNALQSKAVHALELGKVLFFPSLPFLLSPEELKLLSPKITDPKAKNVSYNLQTDQIGGTICSDSEKETLKQMIKRYATKSKNFLETLIPHYTPFLSQARTSLRTVEIAGRKSSYRKDDTRLHVDAFPSNPVRGRRLLRMFTNINPEGKARIWRIGEPFEDVIKKMSVKTSKPIPGFPSLLKWLKITKDIRSPYDHYMLQIHNAMKKDLNYQISCPQEEIHFPPGSTWIVYTDQVSHAAMSGQHVLEQTYYLPTSGLKNPKTSPLTALERHYDRQLL